MDFISNQESQIEAMLAAIGIGSIEELFSAIPKSLRQPRPERDDGLSEFEGLKLMEALAQKNTFSHFESYLGAGAYEHHIPALVGAICSKSEFLTSYTPYQAEASQGTLQTIFEYQSAISALTGMDVANASVWDGASSAAEAVLMALRIHPEKNRIAIFETVHPNYLKVVEQYLHGHPIVIDKIPFLPSGQGDFHISEGTAAILVQSPNVLGVVEEMKDICQQAHAKGALVIQIGNPLAYGIYASPGETGVDIAVGDTQPFGLPLNFGGPYAGYMATREAYLRQLPGRIVGRAKDAQNRVGYTLVLQAREQHIRREKALSNICTNQALAALASLIALLWYGKEGVKQLALTNFQRANYLKNLLPSTLPGPIFNEFTIAFKKPLEQVMAGFYRSGILPGWPCPLLKNHLVVAVTEIKTKEALDRWARVAHEYL
jgi:glycine dehydrogenase subunit 1